MGYILRRLGQAVVVVLAAFIGAFLLLQALPGDAVSARYENPELGLSAAQIADIRAAYGADDPIWVQFWGTLRGYLAGELGYSLQNGASVSTLLGAALPDTVLLAGIGFAVAVGVAVLVATLATYGPFSWLRSLLRGLPPLFVSIPVFWIGIVLIQVFSFQLGLVPVINASPAQALVLPVIAISIPIAAPLAQILIRAIDATGTEAYVTVSRGRGAGPGWLLTHDVARNAVLPALTIAGVLFGELVGGAVVTEAVFSRPGLGTLTQQAVAARDTPVLQAVVVISAVAYVVINLGVDLLYPVLDPRLRKELRA